MCTFVCVLLAGRPTLCVHTYTMSIHTRRGSIRKEIRCQIGPDRYSHTEMGEQLSIRCRWIENRTGKKHENQLPTVYR